MNQYEAFLKIVSVGNITRAAQELGYSQSSVSHMLRMLENEMGCTLLTRDRNGVRLTTEGEQLLPYFYGVCNAQEQLAEQVRKMHGLLTGKIRIGTFTSTSIQWLPLMIRSFHEKYPGIEFELMHGSYLEIEEWINNGSVDCGFVRIPSSTPLKSYFLKEDPFYVIIPEGHRFSKLNEIPLPMVAEEPFIFLDDKGDHDIDPFFRRIGCSPDIRYSAHDVYAVMTMVKVGLGVSLIAGLTTENFDHIERKLLDFKAVRRIGIAVRSHPSAATTEFVGHVRSWVREKYKTPAS